MGLNPPPRRNIIKVHQQQQQTIAWICEIVHSGSRLSEATNNGQSCRVGRFVFEVEQHYCTTLTTTVPYWAPAKKESEEGS